jgi:hypothetical protein
MPISIRPSRHFQGMAFVICLLSLSSLVGAESLWSGTWILRGPLQRDRLIMTIEEAGTGWKLTHQVVGPDASGSTSSTVLTPLDGKDVPVLVDGEPSGQTMGIRRIDSRHTVTVLKFKGKETGNSKAELSPDGKVLTVVIDYAASNPIGKEVQYWDKK